MVAYAGTILTAHGGTRLHVVQNDVVSIRSTGRLTLESPLGLELSHHQILRIYLAIRKPVRCC